MSLEIAELLGRDGPFAEHLEGFEPRPQQQEMAQFIADTFRDQGTLVCEAGTGTGKTLAYLVPAISSGLKTVLSTATKTLQDQLFHRDLPMVMRALNASSDVALLKGRQNYLCLHRLQTSHNALFQEPTEPGVVDKLIVWSKRTETGDLEEITALDDNGGLRPRVTSTADNCLGSDCPDYDSCFVVKARRRAAAADIVVVNHHLLFADMVLRETGFAELLPAAEAVVLDEAHKIPDIASSFFSRSVSAHQLTSLVRDGLQAAQLEAADMPDLGRSLRELDMTVAELRRAIDGFGSRPGWPTLREKPEVSRRVSGLSESLEQVRAAMELAAQRGPALENCARRALELATTWSLFEVEAEREHVHWVDISPRNFSFYDTPISVAREFAQRRDASAAAWVMTSATIAVDKAFTHFCASLGIEGATEAVWDSPFDYENHALLYIPELDLEPGHPGYDAALCSACMPVLQASRGRAFILCTSYRAMHALADLLRDYGEFSVLVQGEAPRSDLLQRFSAGVSTVLVGTSSFWEGVDVRGQQLSVVVIDKLPFAVPDDPVTKARAEAIQQDGRNPFMEMQVPQAITALKQGAGRLIRDYADRGVLVIGDNRMLTRRYGKSFIRSLPPMLLTRDVGEVVRFLDDVE
ncbi:MAG: ATP-dependent DNA helicase [Gammaproteobacteria bacterium]